MSEWEREITPLQVLAIRRASERKQTALPWRIGGRLTLLWWRHGERIWRMVVESAACAAAVALILLILTILLYDE